MGESSDVDIKYVPKILITVLGSVYCLVILCVLLIIPILQVAFGAAYKNECPIEPNIPIYLIVSGSCGIATIVLTIVIVIAMICLVKQKSAGGMIATACILILIILFISLLSTFLSAWFIVGNVWIFAAKSKVQYDNPTVTTTYCNKTLYEFAFWILITSYILSAFSCCCACCTSCVKTGKAIKGIVKESSKT